MNASEISKLIEDNPKKDWEYEAFLVDLRLRNLPYGEANPEYLELKKEHSRLKKIAQVSKVLEIIHT